MGEDRLIWKRPQEDPSIDAGFINPMPPPIGLLVQEPASLQSLDVENAVRPLVADEQMDGSRRRVDFKTSTLGHGEVQDDQAEARPRLFLKDLVDRETRGLRHVERTLEAFFHEEDPADGLEPLPDAWAESTRLSVRCESLDPVEDAAPFISGNREGRQVQRDADESGTVTPRIFRKLGIQPDLTYVGKDE